MKDSSSQSISHPHEGVPLMRLHHHASDERESTATSDPNDDQRSGNSDGKEWPQFMRHISFQRHDSDVYHEDLEKRWIRVRARLHRSRNLVIFAAAICIAVALYAADRLMKRKASPPPHIITIEHAQEHLLDIGGGLRLWYRVWGNRQSGIPLLFVHGGPGNAIADYENSNAQFFDYNRFFVVEVDQRGTGKSQPSVRESCHNMKFYTDISIDKMSHDYELVRKSLDIERWLVFGGSWGSTLSLDYAERYPERCLGLIIRGVYLNTKPEFDAVYTRSPHLNNSKRLREFDSWFKLAAKEAKRAGEPDLDPNDGESFFRVYKRMLLRCDRFAIWHWFVFENNLMEPFAENLRDPKQIEEDQYPEAQSVAFFENVLFYHGTFEEPPDLLARVDRLKSIKVWICQGRYDEVCPEEYAHLLVDALQEAGVSVEAHFPKAGHEASDPVMARCLLQRVDEFVSTLDAE